jgi:hypothetical protein
MKSQSKKEEDNSCDPVIARNKREQEVVTAEQYVKESVKEDTVCQRVSN